MDKSYSKYNVVATFGSGKIGNARLYKKGDRNYVRAAYNGAKTNPRTEGQMRNRLKWANLGVAWQYLKPHLERGFEGQKAYRSAFNLWMRANMAEGLGVFLEKERTAGLICPLQPFVLTKGSIQSNDNLQPLKPTIKEVTEEEVTSIYFSLDDLQCSIRTLEDESGNVPTIGAVSTNLLNNNAWLRNGDMITICGMGDGGSATSSPRPQVLFGQIVIDTENTNPWDFDYLNYPETSSTQSGGMWVIYSETIDPSIKMAVGAIVSRKENGKLTTTSSTMTLTATAETKRQIFLTNSQYQAAAASYGETTTVYLNPTNKE